jgi:hypothetical protein
VETVQPLFDETVGSLLDCLRFTANFVRSPRELAEDEPDRLFDRYLRQSEEVGNVLRDALFADGDGIDSAMSRLLAAIAADLLVYRSLALLDAALGSSDEQVNHLLVLFGGLAEDGLLPPGAEAPLDPAQIVGALQQIAEYALEEEAPVVVEAMLGRLRDIGGAQGGAFRIGVETGSTVDVIMAGVGGSCSKALGGFVASALTDLARMLVTVTVTTTPTPLAVRAENDMKAALGYLTGNALPSHPGGWANKVANLAARTLAAGVRKIIAFVPQAVIDWSNKAIAWATTRGTAMAEVLFDKPGMLQIYRSLADTVARQQEAMVVAAIIAVRANFGRCMRVDRIACAAARFVTHAFMVHPLVWPLILAVSLGQVAAAGYIGWDHPDLPEEPWYSFSLSVMQALWSGQPFTPAPTV